MGRRLSADCVVCVVMLIGVSQTMGDDSSKNAQPTATTARPVTFAGRTLEVWKDLIRYDVDEATRIQGYTALSTFARLGRRVEVAEALEAALDHEQNFQCLAKGYEAALTLGKTAEPMFLRGLKMKAGQQEKAILQTLQTPSADPPSEELVAILLETFQSKKLDLDDRYMASTCLSQQVMAHAFDNRDIKKPVANPAMEPHIKKLVPALEGMLKEEPLGIRHSAAVALLSLAPRRPTVVATVLDYLDVELDSQKSGGASRSRPLGNIARPRRNVKQGGRFGPERTPREYQYRGYEQNGILEEIQRISKRPDVATILMPSLAHLKSLRERHPRFNGRFDEVIMILEESQPKPDSEGK